MSFEQEKMIVGSLPSLYPLQKFEEEAINALVSLPIDDDTISRAKAIEALDKRFDSIPMEQTSEILMLRKDLRELPPAQPPMPSNTSNALEALDSVNATQSNALDCISRAKAIEALKNDMASLDHIIKGMSANDVRLDAYVSQRNQVNYDIYTINNLPPVQPEQLGTNLAEVGTDCISREQAIDICDHAIDLLKGQFGAGALVAIKESIEELPPAQPELIEKAAYIRGFEQGRTQGMIDAQGGKK